MSEIEKMNSEELENVSGGAVDYVHDLSNYVYKPSPTCPSAPALLCRTARAEPPSADSSGTTATPSLYTRTSGKPDTSSHTQPACTAT